MPRLTALSRWRRGSSLLPLLVACAPTNGPSATASALPTPAAAATAATAATAVTAPASTDAIAACETSAGLAVLAHDIELDVSLAPPALTGRGSVRVKALAPTALAVLDARGLTLSQATVASGPAAFSQADGHVCVRLPQPLAAGSETTLGFEWRVEPGQGTPSFAKDEVWAGYSSSAWMPTRLDSAERATLELHITADAALKVAASGRRGAQRAAPEGRTRHSFSLERPSPPFLYAFAVGRFEEAELRVDDLLLRGLAPAGYDLEGGLEATGSMYRFLKSKLGVAHPWGEYLQVFTRGDIAQEAAGLSLIVAQSLSDRRDNPEDDWVFIHELSHQWFGWLVPCADFSDFWLNEAFATFLVGAYQEARWGAAAFKTEVANWHARSARARQQGRDGPIALSSPDGAARPAPPDSELQDRGVTYFRGALVLQRLRTELGEEVFWRGLSDYLKRAEGKSVRTLDLRRALEAASGRELGAFFDRWVYARAADP
ncbi:MAG TPA: M1 family aminopeptidase [Polyangiaceae bacterium]|nr:M1 family aminopeptidase [Polyangiaceae bacterium]